MNAMRSSRPSQTQASGSLSVWIVDDSPEVCRSLELLLQDDTESLRSFDNAQDLFKALERARPACLLLDYELPDANGFEIQTRLNDAGIDVPIVFISGKANVQLAVEAMHRGAIDFIEKPGPSERLISAVTAGLVRHGLAIAGRQAHDRFGQAVQNLSPREHQVVDALGRGMRNKHVARSLDISPRTVESHRESAIRKLNVRNTAELVGVYLMAAIGQANPSLKKCAPREQNPGRR